MQALVEHLDLLAKRDFSTLRRVCQVDDEDLADMVREIRALDPKPGLAFSAAPSVMKNCASGKHLSKVEVSVCKAGGSQIEYTRVTLEEVLVTSVQYTAEQGSDAVFVQYAFQAAKVKQQYWEQTDKGGKGAETVLAWNIKENRES